MKGRLILAIILCMIPLWGRAIEACRTSTDLLRLFAAQSALATAEGDAWDSALATTLTHLTRFDPEGLHATLAGTELEHAADKLALALAAVAATVAADGSDSIKLRAQNHDVRVAVARAIGALAMLDCHGVAVDIQSGHERHVVREAMRIASSRESLTAMAVIAALIAIAVWIRHLIRRDALSDRYFVKLSAKVTIGEESFDMRLHDLSRGGAKIDRPPCSPQKLAGAMTVEFAGIKITGRAAWQNAYACGLRFDRLLTRRELMGVLPQGTSKPIVRTKVATT